jgi:ketosteroid isomerase-like protein
MKTMFRSSLAIAFLFGSLSLISCQKQEEKEKTTTPRYKDVVVENPTAEADMKVVSDFINALVSGDQDKARLLASPTHIGRGPSRLDSANLDKELANWRTNYKTQSDRKVAFVTQTFKVLSGKLKGNWVSLWGDYTFTQAGKTITFPFQYTAGVADGKVMDARIYYDNMAIATQLGYKVTPPDTTKK